MFHFYYYINNPNPFSQTTLDGLVFIEKGLISGFNLENDDFLNAISLNTKYYHNVPEHIKNLVEYINKEIRKKFGKIPEIEEHSKTGVFKWHSSFRHMKGNRYFEIIQAEKELKVAPITIKDMKRYSGNGLLIARDKTKIVSFLPNCSEEALQICSLLRDKAGKKIISNGVLINNANYLDKYCHEIPLFIVKDQDNVIEDKAGLVEVVNLKFKKNEEILQSLVSKRNLRRILPKFALFDCEFELHKEKRYISEEFATYM